MLFDSPQLQDLATPLPERISRAIRRGDHTKALALNREMKESRVRLHDYFADSCTILWSFVAERLGEESLDPMFRYVFALSASRQFLDVVAGGAPAYLTTLMLAKSWRAHSCFGAGDHPASFSISEDSEKFTFHLHPCASGARLIKRGIYEPGRGGGCTKSARPWTYNKEDFSVYCVHCAYLNEILPYESPYGVLMWPVEAFEEPGGDCQWHVYKDPGKIPEALYNRMGLKKQPGPGGKYKAKPGRYFTDSQLKDMARPMTDRIEECLKSGNEDEALKLCHDVKDEFLVLHDLYMNMICATYTYIAGELGEEGLAKALEVQFEKCVASQLDLQSDNLDLRAIVQFLSTNIFGIDAVNGTGYWPGRFSIRETETHIEFILAPCGSGGRLLASGAYEPMPVRRQARERIENAMVYLASKVSLPRSLLDAAFPLIVKHFTQRKPWSQGVTGEAQDWSFCQKGTPYYCCQCGMLARELNGVGLTIKPPDSKSAPCVWFIKKN